MKPIPHWRGVSSNPDLKGKGKKLSANKGWENRFLKQEHKT